VSVETGPAPESDRALSAEEQAAGHKPAIEPARTVVTAACSPTVPTNETSTESTFLDFAYVKQQVPLARVLDHLGLSPRLHGGGPQRRGPCPLHPSTGRGRTFSVNLDANVFQCFDKTCGHKGDVIDLWAALHGLNLRAAALDLVHTFHLEPAPRTGTEKRKG
jgi:CHC2 zinc finger